MEFLYKFGFSKETVQFIEPHCDAGKGKFIFPFSSLVDNQQCSSETIFIDKSFRNADKGLLVVEGEHDTVKTQMFIFDNILNMLAYYENSNRFLFENAVFVVIPIRPNFLEICHLLDKFKHCQNITLIFNNDLTGHCKKILMTAYLFNKNNVKIRLEGEHLQVSIDDVENTFEQDNFNFKRFLSLYQFPKIIKSLMPKGM